MANVENYGWAYIHPTASQAQGRGPNKTLQFQTTGSGGIDANGIGIASGSSKLTFDYTIATASLALTGNMTGSGHISASVFYGDGSSLDGVSSFPYTGNAVVTGSLTVTQAITASSYLIENTTEINNNGSSKFGNSNEDTHVFTGSLSMLSGTQVDVAYTPATNQIRMTGVRVAYRTSSAALLSASSADYIVGLSNTSAVTIELPDASDVGAGMLLVIKDEDSGARSSGNTITVSASSGDQVDNLSHTNIEGTMVSKTFYSNGGTKWFII